MFRTCFYVRNMSTMLQIRNVPEDVHRQLKVRAAQLGMSMSDYVLRELRHILERPTREELLARLQTRSTIEPLPAPEAILADERDR